MRRALAGTALLLPFFAAGQSQPAGPAPNLPRVLWRAPGQLTLDNFVCGPGGCGRTPAPPFQFIAEEMGGSAPKVNVRDSRGLTWSVKFGPEVFPECFAARYVNAVGYMAEPVYCLTTGQFQGVTKLRRAGRYIKKDGTFTKGRFELRGSPAFVFMKNRTWSWVDNPFLGTHELAGLKIVMMLLSNWDAKDARDGHKSNIGEFRVERPEGPELYDGVFDWGATMGEWGTVFSRNQSDCVGYTKQSPKLVKRAEGGRLEWRFKGKRAGDLKRGITVDDARWLLPNLERITPEQLTAALKASGATDRQAGCWTWSIEKRVADLREAAR